MLKDHLIKKKKKKYLHISRMILKKTENSTIGQRTYQTILIAQVILKIHFTGIRETIKSCGKIMIIPMSKNK